MSRAVLDRGSESDLAAHRPEPWWRRVVSNATPYLVISMLVAIALALLAMYPLSRVLLRLFVNNGQIDLSPFRDVFDQPDLWSLLFNTVVVVLASGLVALVVGAVLAFLNERTNASMGLVSDALPLIPFLLPPIAGAIGWALLLSERAGLLNSLIRVAAGKVGITITEGPLSIYSWWGLIFVYALYQVPYVYLMVSAGLRNMDPALEEQSRVSGAGVFRTMRKVTVPGVRPSLGAAVLLMVWFGFALYSVPQIIGTGADIEVLSVRIVRLLTFTFPPQTGLAVGLSMFVVLAVGTAWYFQGRILRSGRHATIGGKGAKPARVELGAWKWPARGLMFGYVFMSAVLPLIGLVLVALNGFWTPHIDWGGLNLGSFREVLFNDPTTRSALRNSVWLGALGATIGMVAAAILAIFVQRSGRWAGQFIDATVKLPAAISTIVMAVGFVLAYSGPPFNLNGTFTILLLAYIALYIPQGSVAADAAAAQVGKELPEASSISGAGGGRTFLRISLPLMLPGLVAGWALLFVRMAGDLTASAMLAGTTNPVVGFRILEVFQGASYATLAALAAVLTAITTTVIVVVLLLTRRRGALRVNVQAS
jgi:iron(III) transport system permease protein